eukprot:scaffold13648_cov38-Phaeocystis_antarctica.AAC.2
MEQAGACRPPQSAAVAPCPDHAPPLGRLRCRAAAASKRLPAQRRAARCSRGEPLVAASGVVCRWRRRCRSGLGRGEGSPPPHRPE